MKQGNALFATAAVLLGAVPLLVLAGGCEKGITDAERDKLLNAMERFSSPPPAEYPVGVPTYPGLRAVDMMGMGGVGTLNASTTSPTEEVVEYYRKAFEAAGWVYDAEKSEAEGEDLYCYRDSTGSLMACFSATYERRPRLTTVIIICSQWRLSGS